jgi:hypothetical protein
VIRKACAVAEAEGFEGRKFVGGLFEALTYINDDRKHMPRSQTFAELLASFNSNEKALADVIDVFRHDDAAFLIADGRAGITPTTHQSSRLDTAPIRIENHIRRYKIS